MANDCSFTCRIAGKTREGVRQFIDALEYKDFRNGYYLCRVFDVGEDRDIVQDGDGIYFAEVSGTCAWSVNSCMGIENTDYGNWRGMDYGVPKFSVWRDYNGGICYANIGMTAPMLCKALGCGIEIWGKEPGCEFQEHYVVNAEGEAVVTDVVKWVEGYDTDENGEFLDYNPDKDEGGFEDYGAFMTPYEIVVGE